MTIYKCPHIKVDTIDTDNYKTDQDHNGKKDAKNIYFSENKRQNIMTIWILKQHHPINQETQYVILSWIS